MQVVGVREIRQNLSVFLRRVREGEAFTVTDHGTPVALLVPVPAGGDDPLAELIASGRVSPPVARGGALPRPATSVDAGSAVTEALLAERAGDER